MRCSFMIREFIYQLVTTRTNLRSLKDTDQYLARNNCNGDYLAAVMEMLKMCRFEAMCSVLYS